MAYLMDFTALSALSPGLIKPSIHHANRVVSWSYQVFYTPRESRCLLVLSSLLYTTRIALSPGVIKSSVNHANRIVSWSNKVFYTPSESRCLLVDGWLSKEAKEEKNIEIDEFGKDLIEDGSRAENVTKAWIFYFEKSQKSEIRNLKSEICNL